jgi:hypothetical protein
MRPSFAFSRCLMVPALAMLCGCGGDSSSTGVNPPPGGPPALAVSALVSGLASPTGMEVPNDGTGRLFILEQGGRIRIIQNGALVATPFLDITSKVESGGEAPEPAAPVGVLRVRGVQFESEPSRCF